MPLYIRDDSVRALAERAAKERRTNLTAVVREALEKLLAESERQRSERDAALDELLATFDKLPELRPYGDPEMYDESGVPR